MWVAAGVGGPTPAGSGVTICVERVEFIALCSTTAVVVVVVNESLLLAEDLHYVLKSYYEINGMTKLDTAFGRD